MAKHMTGMTLIEVLITVAIAGIILAWGLPNLADYVRTSRVVSATNELLGALNAARSFAVSRSVKTVVCASNNGTSCSGSNTNWKDGWLVFEDCNNDDTLDTGNVACADGSRPETIVRVGSYSSGSISVANTNDKFNFAATGLPSDAQTFTVKSTPVCKATPSMARTISVSTGGRTLVDPASCS